ncbi:hypothetical protein OROGR_026540 [Orobanche gracilis]
MAPMANAYADEVYNHDPDTRETHRGVFEEFSQEGDFCFLPKDRLGSIGPTQKQKGNCCWAFVTLSLIRTMLFYLLTPELFKIFRGVSLMELLVRVHCFSPSVLPSWFNNMRDAFTVVEIFGLYSWDHPINEDTEAGIREGDFKFHVGKFECLDREIPTPQVPNPTNQKILDLVIRSLIAGVSVDCFLQVGCPDFPSFKVHKSQEWTSAWIDALHTYVVGSPCCQSILPPTTNIPQAYVLGNSEEQAFIQNLALFFRSFFKIMGLNPPFGVHASLANQFIKKALKFDPKLLILIVPEETARPFPYDLIWEDKKLLAEKSILPPTTNIPQAYALGNSEEQCHIRVLEASLEGISALLVGLEYLTCISYDDLVVLKVCLDYWNFFLLELFEAHHNADNPVPTAAMMGLQTSMLPGMVDGLELKLRLLVISQMSKPGEVLIVEAENGNIVHETFKDNDVLVQYKIMSETHLDHEDTEKQRGKRSKGVPFSMPCPKIKRK